MKTSFRRFAAKTTITFAMSVWLSTTGCAAPEEDAEDSVGAVEAATNDQAAASAASALKALLAEPDQLVFASAPVATVDDFTFYAQPSKASIEKKGASSADEPITTFVGINADGEILYVDLATGGAAGVAPGKDIRKSLGTKAATGVRPQNLVAKGTTIVFEEVVTIIRRATLSFGEVRVGTITRVAEDGAGAVTTNASDDVAKAATDDVAKVATDATDKLRTEPATIYAAGSSKVRGNPTSVRGLTADLVARMSNDVPGTIAIGADEAARLLAGHHAVYIRKMDYNLRGWVKRNVDGATVHLNVDGVTTVEATAARRIMITDPSTYRGGLATRTDDAVVGAGFYENQALAETLADRIVVADMFTGMAGPRNISAHIHQTLENIRRRIAAGRPPQVTLTFVGTSHSIADTAVNAREVLAGLRNLPEAQHLRLDFQY